MFKGSKNVRPDQHPSWITSIGGEANAETDEDSTIYWETVPSQYLPLALWLEADRMASLDVSEDTFRTELDVVKEERRMRFENQPFGLLPRRENWREPRELSNTPILEKLRIGDGPDPP